MTCKIDKGLLLFGFMMGTMAIIAGIFASNTLPTIFQTRELVVQTQHHFNQSDIEKLNLLHNMSAQILNISNELKHSQEVHDMIATTGKEASELNVQMTKINKKNIDNIMNNITEINSKLFN